MDNLGSQHLTKFEIKANNWWHFPAHLGTNKPSEVMLLMLYFQHVSKSIPKLDQIFTGDPSTFDLKVAHLQQPDAVRPRQDHRIAHHWWQIQKVCIFKCLSQVCTFQMFVQFFQLLQCGCVAVCLCGFKCCLCGKVFVWRRSR